MASFLLRRLRYVSSQPLRNFLPLALLPLLIRQPHLLPLLWVRLLVTEVVNSGLRAGFILSVLLWLLQIILRFLAPFELGFGLVLHLHGA